MLSLIVGSEWINSNIDIYPLSIGPIILRVSLFCLILGVWVGYFKLIFALIDKKKKISYIYISCILFTSKGIFSTDTILLHSDANFYFYY